MEEKAGTPLDTERLFGEHVATSCGSHVFTLTQVPAEVVVETWPQHPLRLQRIIYGTTAASEV